VVVKDEPDLSRERVASPAQVQAAFALAGRALDVPEPRNTGGYDRSNTAHPDWALTSQFGVGAGRPSPSAVPSKLVMPSVGLALMTAVTPEARSSFVSE
jgi:hypothetical protein